MIITTKNGKHYLFTIHDNSIRFQMGAREVIVTEFINIAIGKPLELRGFKCDMYYNVSDDFYYYRSSTPIVSIR